MKAWVLWHKPGIHFEPCVKRVYLDGSRAAEDFELLKEADNSQWQLDEFEVFGPIPMPSTQPAAALSGATMRAASPKSVPTTFVEKCMANPHSVVAWCRRCNAPADNIELIEDGGQLTAIITHHGESVHMVINEKSGTASEAGSIIVQAFKPEAEAA